MLWVCIFFSNSYNISEILTTHPFVITIELLVVVTLIISLSILPLFYAIKTKVHDTIQQCTLVRPSVDVSLSLRRGLEKIQQDFDSKRLERIRQKSKKLVCNSVAF